MSDRVLVVADLVSRRSDDQRFRPSQLSEAFLELNVPPPGNPSSTLATLKGRDHVLQHPNGRWALTPAGRRAAIQLGIEVGPDVDDASGGPSAEFAHTSYTVIPAWAAPPRWASGIGRLLDRHPFETNVLCMTRFPSEGDLADPVAAAILQARDVLSGFGLTLHLASDAIVEDDLLGNVGAYMWACQYGLAIVEDRVGRGLNINAVMEVAGMTVTGRRCAILRDRTSPELPTDLAGQIYKPVDLDDTHQIQEAVHGWAEVDLGLTRRSV
jgi:hypothetical protein